MQWNKTELYNAFYVLPLKGNHCRILSRSQENLKTCEKKGKAGNTSPNVEEEEETRPLVSTSWKSEATFKMPRKYQRCILKLLWNWMLETSTVFEMAQ